MFQLWRSIRVVVPAIVALSGAGCVTTTESITPDLANTIQSADIVIRKNAEEFYFPHGSTQGPAYNPYSYGAGGSGGVLGAFLAGAIVGAIQGYQDASRGKPDALTRSLITQAGLKNRHFEDVLERTLRANFARLTWFHHRPVTQFSGSLDGVAGEAMNRSKADVVAVISPKMEFIGEFSTLQLTIDFEMYPVSENLAIALGNSSGIRKPFFQTRQVWTEKMPEEKIVDRNSNMDYWSDDDGEAVKSALRSSFRYLSAKLHAEITDTGKSVTVPTLADAPKPGHNARNAFLSIAARNDHYRQMIGDAEATWPSGIFGIIQTCEIIDKIDECRRMKATAEEEIASRRLQLIVECEAATIEAGGNAAEPVTAENNCRALTY